jgi:hypothetical protein
MSQSFIIALSGVLAVTTVGAGWFEGRLSNRWGEPADLASAGAALENVPTQVGDWEMISTQPFSEETLQMLECAGHFTRTYQNRVTGEQVNVALLVGPPGPTAVHTPEICYSSRDHEITESRVAVHAGPEAAPDQTLWKLTFRSNDLEQSMLRVYYGWHATDGSWQASENPRFEYGGASLLYKIQLAGRMPSTSSVADGDSCSRFLRAFLPAVDVTLFTASQN